MSKSTYFTSVLAALCCCLTAFYLYNPPKNPVPNEMASLKQISRSIVKKVYAAETSEGVGATVRRSIGSMSLRNLSPFLMLDHFDLSRGGGFPDHPHRGQATVTYMIEGASQHEDSRGHKGIIKTGGVQWMCAGKGIIHSEIPLHVEGAKNPNGLQLWVDLPKQYKMVDPSYQELDAEQIPSAYPEGEDGNVRIKLISGKSFGVESPVRPLGGCWYMHIFLKKTGAKVFQDLPAGWTSFIYVLKGAVAVNKDGGDSTAHRQHHTLVLSAAANETGVAIEAGEDETEVVLISGEPLDQPVVQYGPFVMTSREEIQQTLRDYQGAKNGFEAAHSWQSDLGQKFLKEYGRD
ncbi:Pirin-like protein [Serendipita indica DSM 11827]|nr:Pirin-like protein [Serendipita indica DSM 11827]